MCVGMRLLLFRTLELFRISFSCIAGWMLLLPAVSIACYDVSWPDAMPFPTLDYLIHIARMSAWKVTIRLPVGHNAIIVSWYRSVCMRSVANLTECENEANAEWLW